MNRRYFLLTASAAGLVACTGPSSYPQTSVATRDAPAQLDAYVIDAQTPFGDTHRPYLNALAETELGRAPGIDWVALPEYGRQSGAVVVGAMVAVAERRSTLETFFDGLPPAWQLPATHDLRFGQDRWPDGSGPPRWGARVVEANPVIETSDVVSVRARDDSVEVLLDREGATRLETLSARNVGQRLAIVLDDEIVADPIINETIPGGKIELTVRNAEADDYADLAQRFMG